MHKKVIVVNALSLYILQAANYLIPLLVLPFLTRVLGAELFGLMVFASSLVQYFVTFTDYGFNLSASRLVSIHRDDDKKVSEIFWSVLIIKVSIAALCAVAFTGLVVLVPRFRHDIWIYVVSYMAVLGNIIFPVWLYQGKERIFSISIINLVAKVVTTALLLVVVRSKQDLLYAAALQSAGVVVAGIISVFHVQTLFTLRYRIPPLRIILDMARDGWAVFVSLVSVSLISNSPVVLLGLLSSNLSVGYFAIAQKIVWAFANLVQPIANSVFPRMGYLFAHDAAAAIRFLRKLLLLFAPLFTVITVLLFVSAPLLVRVVSGVSSWEITVLIRIMSIIPLLIFIDNNYGMQIMLNNKMDHAFMRIYVAGCACMLIASVLLIPWIDARGAAIGMVLAEAVVLTMMYLTVRRSGIRLFTRV